MPDMLPIAKRRSARADGGGCCREAAKIEDIERQLRDIQRRLDALEDAARASSETGLRMLWSDLDRLKRDRYTNQDEASELDRRLQEAGDDQGAVRQAQYDHEQTVKKIALLEEGIEKQEDALAENDRNLARVRVRLESSGGADVEGARQRRRLCADLHGLFDEAVAKYRDRLRRSVEADATELFLQLTTEPEYTGLRINESYGLTILHQDGSEIPVRSAGAEHVVASVPRRRLAEERPPARPDLHRLAIRAARHPAH